MRMVWSQQGWEARGKGKTLQSSGRNGEGRVPVRVEGMEKRVGLRAVLKN